MDVNYVFDPIGFLENNLIDLTGKLVKKPLHPKLVSLLNDTFILNNPELHLVSAAHQFARVSLQFIIEKVRQELIIGLQKIDKDLSIQNGQDTINQPTLLPIKDDKNSQISVFVTYAWEGTEHNEKIISFVDFLRKNGYNATLDRKLSQEETAINFNQMMLRGIQNNEKVIVVLSKKYKEKADSFTGGVGMEYSLIIEELKTKINKFIFVSFGENNLEEIVPTGIAGRDVLDLKKDQDSENFNGLFAKLQSKTLIQFSEVNPTMPEVQVKEIKPFKL